MNRFVTYLMLSTGILFLSLYPETAYGFRCGTRLVSINDTTHQVLQKCGQPDDIQSWKEERIMRDYRYYDRNGGSSRYRDSYLVKIHVNIEEWTYNLGSTRFIRYLRFENGRLKKITTGDWGH